MKFDGQIVFLILVFAAVFTAGQAVIGMVSVATQKRKVNKRLKVAERVDGVSALVMELRKQRGLNADGEKGKGLLRWLSNLIVASGVPYNPKKWIAYSAMGGMVCGMAAAVVTKHFIL
ncbi:MAG: pilus assembly protein TadB, partial [Proteobacteria bacterium]|nr:pilus assembly protein TadB [Pseudomonadota bacterium]